MVLVAAVLHDTIEELRERFGVKVADVVAEITDDKNLSEWRREDFDWARPVIDGLRGTHRKLERLFDAAYAGRP